MTGQYTALLLITSVIWVLLWFGYRQNKINDEIKKKEKEERINEKVKRRAVYWPVIGKLASEYLT